MPGGLEESDGQHDANRQKGGDDPPELRSWVASIAFAGLPISYALIQSETVAHGNLATVQIILQNLNLLSFVTSLVLNVGLIVASPVVLYSYAYRRLRRGLDPSKRTALVCHLVSSAPGTLLYPWLVGILMVQLVGLATWWVLGRVRISHVPKKDNEARQFLRFFVGLQLLFTVIFIVNSPFWVPEESIALEPGNPVGWTVPRVASVLSIDDVSTTVITTDEGALFRIPNGAIVGREVCTRSRPYTLNILDDEQSSLMGVALSAATSDGAPSREPPEQCPP